jgi:transcriptional regulator GlxA family with amidase domain
MTGWPLLMGYQAMQMRRRMKEITVLLLDQMFSSTATGPMEVFRHAGFLWNILTGTKKAPRFRVTTASAGGRPVTCDGGICIQPNRRMEDVGETDLIFVPAAWLTIDGSVQLNVPVVRWLKQRSDRGVAVASVCSGVGLVAAAGLLDGKRATTHWALADRFRHEYPRVKWMPEMMVTEDSGLYCGGGVNASLDLSIYLVERFCGHEIAVQTAKALLIETRRAWQSGFAIIPLKTDHRDDAISHAQEWMHDNFAKTFSLEDLARHVGMSVRNFVRRFKQATGDSALVYLQKLRIAAAKRMLESKHRSMQEISDAVGYQDVPFFRAVFQRHAGISPRAYQDRFGMQ